MPDELQAVVGGQSASAFLDVTAEASGWPWPTAAQVGVTVPYDELTPVDSQVTTTHDGQVIEGLDVSSRIRVYHSNVLVRNCRMRPGGNYGMYIKDGGHGDPVGVVFEDCEVDYSQAAESSSSTPLGAYKESTPLVTFRRVHLHSAFRGLLAVDAVLVEDCLFEVDRQDLANFDAHRTAFSIRPRGAEQSIIRRSHIRIATPKGASSALSIYPDLGTPRNVTVQDSLLDCHDASGEPMAAYASIGGQTDATHIKYLDNYITHGRSGYVASHFQDNEGNEFTGNRDWPSESPI